jgi:hypothetical protein
MLREDHRLRVPENGAIRRMFGYKKEEVAGGWRTLHNEELHYLHVSPNIMWMIKSRIWAVNVARNGEMRNEYNIFVGKREGKRPLRRHTHRWGDNIRMDPRKKKCVKVWTGSG